MAFALQVAVMYLGRKLLQRTRFVRLEDMDLKTDVYVMREEHVEEEERETVCEVE